MWKKLKRPLAFVLTVAMLVSLTNFEQFSVLAEGAPETTTTAAESKTSEKAEEKNTEKSEKEESASEKTTAEKKESGESSDKEETKEDSEKKSSESQTEAAPESTTGKKEEGTSAKEKEDASTEKKEDGKKYADSYAITTKSTYANNDKSIKVGGKATVVYLKDGEELSIKNLPYGVKYTVTEAGNDGYTVTNVVTDENGAEGTIDSALETDAYTNTKDGTVDTGVIMSYAPYIAMIAVACVFAVMFFRRREDV